MSFSKNLQRLRQAAGLSQSELARKSGIAVKTIQNWEIGRNLPRTDALVKLAQALQTTVDGLLARPEPGQTAPKRSRHRK
jgi:transcriptional regulator with XRE-family HTH domain